MAPPAGDGLDSPEKTPRTPCAFKDLEEQISEGKRALRRTSESPGQSPPPPPPPNPYSPGVTRKFARAIFDEAGPTQAATEPAADEKPKPFFSAAAPTPTPVEARAPARPAAAPSPPTAPASPAPSPPPGREAKAPKPRHASRRSFLGARRVDRLRPTLSDIDAAEFGRSRNARPAQAPPPPAPRAPSPKPTSPRTQSKLAARWNSVVAAPAAPAPAPKPRRNSGELKKRCSWLKKEDAPSTDAAAESPPRRRTNSSELERRWGNAIKAPEPEAPPERRQSAKERFLAAAQPAEKPEPARRRSSAKVLEKRWAEATGVAPTPPRATRRSSKELERRWTEATKPPSTSASPRKTTKKGDVAGGWSRQEDPRASCSPPRKGALAQRWTDAVKEEAKRRESVPAPALRPGCPSPPVPVT